MSAQTLNSQMTPLLLLFSGQGYGGALRSANIIIAYLRYTQIVVVVCISPSTCIRKRSLTLMQGSKKENESNQSLCCFVP